MVTPIFRPWEVECASSYILETADIIRNVYFNHSENEDTSQNVSDTAQVVIPLHVQEIQQDVLLFDDDSEPETNTQSSSAAALENEIESGSSQISSNSVMDPSHANRNVYYCEYCTYDTFRLTNFRYHMKTKHSNEKPRTCNYCERSFSRTSDLRNHIKASHGFGKRYSCPHCKFRTAYYYRLIDHVQKMHTNERTFSCDLCSYRTVRSVDLKDHMSTAHISAVHMNTVHSVTDNKRHPCPHCVFSTAYRACLRKHIEAKHTNYTPQTQPNHAFVHANSQQSLY